MEKKTDKKKSGKALQVALGFRIKTLRKEKGMASAALAKLVQVDSSYITRIEQGKRSPSLEVLSACAKALGVTPDELLGEKPNSEQHEDVVDILVSDAIQDFPYEVFGLKREDFIALLTTDPEYSKVLSHTIRHVASLHQVQVGPLLLEVLKYYQQAKNNYFEEIELQAEQFRQELNLKKGDPLREDLLHTELEKRGIEIGHFENEGRFEECRWVYLNGREKKKLLVNANLTSEQRAFCYAREIGYIVRKLANHRPFDTSVLSSFSEAYAYYMASYFAGAAMINKLSFDKLFLPFLEEKQFDGSQFLSLNMQAPYESYFYRIGELLATHGLTQYQFLRFESDLEREKYENKDEIYTISKATNMSKLPDLRGLDGREQYCGRFLEINLMRELRLNKGSRVVCGVQRAKGLWGENFHKGEIFVFSIAYRTVLNPARLRAVSLSYPVTSRFRQMVGFHDDPHIPSKEIHVSCERCHLHACNERRSKGQHVYEMRNQRASILQFIEDERDK